MFWEIVARFSSGAEAQQEKQLLRMYTEVLSRSGMSHREARRQARMGIKLCKEAARREGSVHLPDHYGDILLEGARKGRPECQRRVERAKNEGATETDIRRWWNQSDLRRRMTCWAEDVAVRLPMYLAAKRHGLSDKEAEQKVRRFFPLYGDPRDCRYGSGDDRPLPHELRHRVENYRRNRSIAQMRKKIEQYSSYNALVRAEIRSGNL